MASTPTRACLRCHKKKTKCTGYPGCQGCINSGTACEPYKRTRKSDHLQSLRDASQRVKWLEDQIFQHWGIDCQSLPTDTPLQPVLGSTPSSNLQASSSEITNSGIHSSPQVLHASGSPELGTCAPELSLVALNATGDMRYLGPSSGAFFVAYAASLARKSALDRNLSKNCHISPTEERISDTASLARTTTTLSHKDTRLLLLSYEMWIHPIYPLMNLQSLRDLIDRCREFQSTDLDQTMLGYERNSEMTIFYLIMALGATNYSNTRKQLQGQRSTSYSIGQEISPGYLYSKALDHFNRNSQCLKPSVSAIQIILLISIYSSYGPIESSQWQLVGLAIRMATEIGLHYSPRICNTSEQEVDERSRVFWTAYAIEIQLTYNLGRPPSIGQEHITARMPEKNDETYFGIHHFKHRQIQNRIISKVYCVNYTPEDTTIEANEVINSLQLELEQWRSEIPIDQSQGASPYPYSYWDRLYHSTSFVLHRSSPLCPRPLGTSLEKCIRSAGAYIDNVLDILRNSNIPLSWMLVQGVLFAGLTMLITARTGFRQLALKPGLPFLLVDFPTWTRKCSICLAILNERWNEDILIRLETEFEVLSNDSLRTISSSLTGQTAEDLSHMSGLPESTSLLPPFVPEESLTANGPNYGDTNLVGDWESLDLFKEFLGIDETQTFWDIFPESQEFTF